MFTKTPARSRGSSKKEKTRDELLAEVRSQRAARSGERQRTVAATAIQAAWRGLACRKRLHAALLAETLAQATPLVLARAGQQPVDASWVAGWLLPRLMAVLPRPTDPAQPVRLTGPTLKLARAALALLIRSLTASSPQHNYVAWGLQQQQQGAAWQLQVLRLLRVCCALMCAGAEQDAVLDAAAVRVLGILLDPRAWKCDIASSEKEVLAAGLLARARPALAAPLAAATARALGLPGSGPNTSAQKLLALATLLLAPADEGGQHPKPQSEHGLAWAPFTRSVFPSPCLLHALSGDTRAALAAPPMLRVLCDQLQQNSGGGNLPPDAALWAAANLTLLITGAPAPSGASPLTGAGCVRGDPGLAAAYCRACAALLVASRSATPTPASAAAAAALWPLAQRAVIFGLLDAVLAGGPEGEGAGLPLLAGLWAEAIDRCTELQRSSAVMAGGGGGGVPPLLSAISFTPGVLPRLWRWLAVSVGLPLEAPREASRGLAVATLAGGYTGLAPSHALVLGLFCRLYHHLLNVVDDDEFHAAPGPSRPEAAGGLSVNHARAVATCLNTLVYHTYLPVKTGQKRASETGGDGLVAAYAPLLLRSLFERHCRRPFCQPALWLAPYQAMYGSVDTAVAAHREALLRRADQAAHDAMEAARAARAGRSVATAEPSSDGRGSTTSGGGSSVRGFFSRVGQMLRPDSPERPARQHTAADSIWASPTQPSQPTTTAAAAVPTIGMFDGLLSLVGLGADSGVSEVAADPRQALVGPFRAGRVVRALLAGSAGGGAGEEDEEEGDLEIGGAPGLPALRVRAAEGARPESMASLLRTAPQAVPFDRRVELFRALLAEDKARGGFDRAVYEGGAAPLKARIRRGALMDDAYRALAGLGPALRARLVVTFVNDQGLEEAGLDYGGLMKEFLEEVVVRGFHADAGLWATCSSSGQVYPRPSAHRMESGVQLLEFLGQMVGKALYEGILLNVSFAPFFITRLQGRSPQLDDLRTLDPGLHRSLMQVKTYEGDVADLCLTFSVEDDFFGQTTQHALLPGQANTPVTNDNRLLYCHLLADWHLNVQLGRAADAFARGLSAIIPPASLRLFSPEEFNQLVSGGGDEGGALDVADMKRYARYSGGYHPDSSTVRLFWQVMADFTPAQRGLLLRFCTSCSRAPLGGFRYLQPPLTIHKVDSPAGLLAVAGGQDVDRLPSASTCYNTLKLPNYRRKDTLKQKLLYAISAGAGFELS